MGTSKSKESHDYWRLVLVAAPNPPIRMPFGSDTVARIEAKNNLVAKELAIWRDLAVSTDFATSA
jgi:hypothetical protein